MVETITAMDLARLLDERDNRYEDQSVALLDTRDEESFESWHLPGAIHFPFEPDDMLDDRFNELENLVGDAERILTICGKGISSGTLAGKLDRATDAYDVTAVEGGMQAWSRVYYHVPLSIPSESSDSSIPNDDSSTIVVVQLQRRATGCLGYLVGETESGSAIVVDPTTDVKEFLIAAGTYGFQIDAVVDTHVHADHISGGPTLARRLDVPYYMGEHARDRDVITNFEPLADGDRLRLGENEARIHHTPGHTSEMITLVVDDRVAFTADTLHVQSTGRTELEFGDADAERGARYLYESLHGTILSLQDDVVVCPGHVPVDKSGIFEVGHPGDSITTTIGEARESIDVLGLDEDAFVSRVIDAGEKPANYEEIIDINRGAADLENFDRVTMELGPNNCSA